MTDNSISNEIASAPLYNGPDAVADLKKDVLSLPYAHGKPDIYGVIRQQPEDFFVEEILGFEPEGEGEHVFLLIEKTGHNSQYIADLLAKFAGLHPRLVSLSGAKDRHAVTRQWFSVHLPGSDTLDWQLVNSDTIKVLQVKRHPRKLRRGVHRGNRFVITVRALSDNSPGKLEELDRRMKTIQRLGVPNYFGEQRFGHGGGNIIRAKQWFAGQLKPRRQQRSIYLSAARSYLFNQLLAHRVSSASWQQLLEGELLMLDGSHSIFAQSAEPNLTDRLAEGDVHLTGPMYGKAGALRPSDSVAELEQQILNAYPELLAGLEREGLKAVRRSLRIIPENLAYNMVEYQEGGTQCFALEWSFSLPSGCFATAVIRELVAYTVATPERQPVDNKNIRSIE